MHPQRANGKMGMNDIGTDFIKMLKDGLFISDDQMRRISQVKIGLPDGVIFFANIGLGKWSCLSELSSSGYNSVIRNTSLF